MSKEWQRKYRVRTTHGYLVGIKRPRPEDCCELCNEKTQILDYHHWNDEDLSKGLWLCKSCHNFAEVVDKGLFEQMIYADFKAWKNRKKEYLNLKLKVEKRMKT